MRLGVKLRVCSLPFFLMLLIAVACGRAGTGGDHAFETRDEDGIPTAITGGGPRYQGELFRYDEVLRLTEAGESPEALIGRADAMLMDEEGNLYIRDSGNVRIAVFDRDGRHLTNLGRAGNGPGEFTRWGFQLMSVSGGMVEIYDYMLRRTTWYRRDGEVVTTVPAPGPMSGAQVRHLPETDRFFCEVDAFRPRGEIMMQQGGFLVTTAAGDTVGEVRLAAVEAQYHTYDPGAGVGNQDVYFPMPYGPAPSVVLTAAGEVAVTIGQQPVVTWYGLDGTLLRRARLDLAVGPVPPDLRARELALLDSLIDSSEGRVRQRYQIRRESLRFPATMALWRGMAVDTSGYVWLGKPRSLFQPWTGGDVYLVLSPDGEYLGTTRPPVNGVAAHGHYLGVVRDAETGAEIPTVWRLVPVPAGFSYP